eukprot:CAMPEP_0194533240 /NCGR_PEP_ID=MMETSP0253-20130528/71074_1 /TAXON_ID=2966 /ORGANISM="Noctiluca scintillans" /LENGTH=92 /DNA_ID=CAMNT_0039378775 /DNA_START=186 /DNA_END=464 /DNA_ORIENTATION=-
MEALHRGGHGTHKGGEDEQRNQDHTDGIAPLHGGVSVDIRRRRRELRQAPVQGRRVDVRATMVCDIGRLDPAFVHVAQTNQGPAARDPVIDE